MSVRDDRIADRYRGGDTMQAIADDEGLTRARVQQILAGRGEVAAVALEVRKSRRRDAQSKVVDGFWTDHGATVAALANQGLSKQQVLDRFGLVFPELDSAIVQSALDRSGITYSKPLDPRHFTDAALELGVWFVVGLDLELPADRGAALASTDFEDAFALREALRARGFTDGEIADFLATAIGARDLATTTACSLSKSRYDKLRIPTVQSQQKAQTLHSWPADAQTVMKRLGSGYWTDAMVTIGLVPNDRGRSRGLLLFDEGSYPEALSNYTFDRRATGAQTTYADYDAWRRREYRDGRTWPSAIAIRNRYGSWSNALRSADDRHGSDLRDAPSSRDVSESAKTLHAVREEMTRRLEAIQAGGVDRAAAVRDFLMSYAGNFEIDRREWLRAMILTDPRSVPRRLEPSAPKLDKKQRVLLELSPPDIAGALTDRVLDRMLSGGGIANVDGWLAPSAQTELDALPASVPALYELLRAARNLATHDSDEARLRLREALDGAAAVDAQFVFKSAVTELNVIRWLAANDQARLKKVAEVMPQIWRAMTAAEAVLRSEL
jgi:hypothetical protein